MRFHPAEKAVKRGKKDKKGKKSVSTCQSVNLPVSRCMADICHALDLLDLL